ncbi:MAG: FprA family A-type flavoprotein [Clostridia bacterium]|nr:FprA family A-type flavoprotein [Clostridia bacterium]
MKKITYIGVNDRLTDLFEGQFDIPNGISYNSYLVRDEKIAIMDSVDLLFFEEWLENIKREIGDTCPDFLIVSHMEPDHSSSIFSLMAEYPSIKIVATKKAFNMMKGFFGTDFPNNQIVVDNGDRLSLGECTLTFYTAPMVHWPEVMVSYLDTEKTLFSADAFGKFGALDADEEWACEARRYYFGIVGKYGTQVQALLKKVSSLEIERICPLHGPVLEENLDYYLNLYNIWSSYAAEKEGVFIAYTSVYGNTAEAAALLQDELQALGVATSLCDLAREDMHEAIEDAFKYSKLVLATTTYNNGIFPYMREFITHLTERSYQSRTVAFIENGSWAPNAARTMKAMLENSKNLTIIDTGVTILSSLTEENEKQISALARELAK